MSPIKPKDSDNHLDQTFRQNLLNHEVEVPAGIWDAVSNDLDAHQQKIKYNHWYYVALLLLIPISALNIYYGGDSGNTNQIAENGFTQSISEPNFLNDELNVFEALKSGNFTSSTVGANNNTGGLSSSTNNTGNKPTTASNSLTASLANTNGTSHQYSSGAYMASNSKSIVFVGGNYSNFGLYSDAETIARAGELADLINNSPALSYRVLSALTNNDALVLPKEKTATKKKSKRNDVITMHNNSPLGKMRGLYAGADIGVNFSRMYLKNDALYPLIGKEITYYFDPSYYYSLSVGYSFSSKFAIEAEWIINSTKAQRYLDNPYGKLFINGSMTLNYTEIPVMAKYRITRLSRITKAPVSFNIVAGVSYSRLKTSTITIGDGVVDDANEFFAKNEVGALLGLEYDMYLTNNLFLNLGVRSGISADTKTFKSIGEDVPRIYTVSLGIHAGVYFKLPYKTKYKSKGMK